MATSVIKSLLGARFLSLDPMVQWVHDGRSRVLTGAVTVQRGTSYLSRILGLLGSLPPPMTNASIEVEILVAAEGEQWIRVFGPTRLMKSTFRTEGDLLIERLGTAALTFSLQVRDGELDWTLTRISALGIPLPLRWFTVSATINEQHGRYHFKIDSALRGVGRIVCYEGSLNARR